MSGKKSEIPLLVWINSKLQKYEGMRMWPLRNLFDNKYILKSIRYSGSIYVLKMFHLKCWVTLKAIFVNCKKNIWNYLAHLIC